MRLFMKFASFDLESAVGFPDDVEFTEEHFNQLGITCATVALVDTDEIQEWHDTDQVRFWYSDSVEKLSREDCQEIVRDLSQLVDEGYTLVTWNGTGFDFKLLAVESGMYAECADLAYYHHIDMMLIVVFLRGHFLGLNKALDGIGNAGKLHEVRLTDGTLLVDMKGKLAPELWARGEFDAVLTYLNYDVTEPLAVLQFIYKNKSIQWVTARGSYQSFHVPSMYSVRELYETLPDNSNWGKFNITKEQFVAWMPRSH